MENPLQFYSEDQLLKIKESFQLFDDHGDGTICGKDVGTILRALGKNPTEIEILDMLLDLEREVEEYIDFPEFLLVYHKTKREQDSVDVILEAFKVFDKNGTGKISLKELKHAMTSMGEQMSDEEVDMLMKECDLDGDGELDYNEFVQMMQRY